VLDKFDVNYRSILLRRATVEVRPCRNLQSLHFAFDFERLAPQVAACSG